MAPSGAGLLILKLFWRQKARVVLRLKISGMILPVVAVVLRLQISQPRGASGKARPLVKLLQFSLGASSISVVQWS